jgi:hypothetical protein
MLGHIPSKCRKRDDRMPQTGRHYSAPPQGSTQSGYALAVHGGAGVISRGPASAEWVLSYHEGLRRALAAGRNCSRQAAARSMP